MRAKTSSCGSSTTGAPLPGVAAELASALESRRHITVTALLDADRIDLARRVLGSRLRTMEGSAEGARARITVDYEELDGVRQLLQFGDHLEVVAPEAARRRVRALALQLAAAHQ